MVTTVISQEKQSLVRMHLKGIVRMPKAFSGGDSDLQPENTIMRCRRSNGIANGDSEKVELLATYSDFSHPFPLRDLAIISKVVVASVDSYLPLTQQCYWFTRTMVGISVAHYHPQPAEGINNIARDRSGRINHLPFLPVLDQDNLDEITSLVDLVRKAVAADDLQVGHLRSLSIYFVFLFYAHISRFLKGI